MSAAPLDGSLLLDANVPIALAVREHASHDAAHDAAHRWLASVGRFAICPITEGVRV